MWSGDILNMRSDGISLLGIFNHGEYNRQELEKYEPFDFVMMNGLLHHLDDATAPPWTLSNSPGIL